MIQAPNMQYIPAQQGMPVNYQVQGAANMPAAVVPNPGVFYNYPAYSCFNAQTPYNSEKPQFNGVNIEIFNPQGQAGMPAQGSYQMPMPAQFVPVQAPVIIPQSPVINQNPITYNVPAQPMPPAAPMAQPAQPMPIPNAAAPVQVPAPQIPQTEAPAAAAPVIAAPQAPDPSKSAETFAGRLKTDDLDAQNAVIEEIATAVKENPQLGPHLLDELVFDELVNIVNKDTSKLPGATPEIIELRQKPQEQLTEEEKTKAFTPTPLDQAERNKQHALYTISFMQDLLNDEILKRNGQNLELKDLPAIDTVIEAAKSNQNPSIRAGALASLAYIAKPQYKEDLKTIFELAKADEDSRVQEAAQDALNSLDKKAA